jgi:large subunit ribosomal protein L25
MSTATQPKIHAEVRERTGTRYAARNRAKGMLPGVIYGHKQDPIHVSVNAKELIELLHHNAHVIEVEVAGKSEPCLVKDVQWDHLSKHIIHVDLARVDLNEEVEIELELKLVGEAVGLKVVGALLEQAASTIEVKCRANAIPEFLTHDVSALEVGDSVLVSDLKLPAGVTAVSDADTLVAHISVTKEESEEEAAAEGAAEPEVIGKAEAEEEADEK